jgi:hypothetical protein
MKSKEQRRQEALERAAKTYAIWEQIKYNHKILDKYPTMDSYLNMFRTKKEKLLCL